MSTYDSEQLTAVDEVMRSRRSTRAFLGDLVPRELISALLDAAITAPSTFNTQPWRVHVLSGSVKQRLSDALLRAHGDTTAGTHVVIPESASPELVGRQRDFFRRYYEALGIDSSDKEARSVQTGRNYSFFGAPVGLIFTIDSALTRHSWLDMGLFVQSVMLAAQARGLATCPQVSFARHEPVIRQVLGLPDGDEVACGMSLGYPDMSAPVNQMTSPREPFQRVSVWHGFDDDEFRTVGGAE
jgi:nitroreductase